MKHALVILLLLLPLMAYSQEKHTPFEVSAVINGSDLLGPLGVEVRYGNIHLSQSVRPQVSSTMSYVTNVTYGFYGTSIRGLVPVISVNYASHGGVYITELSPYGYDIANIDFSPTYGFMVGVQGLSEGREDRLYARAYVGMSFSEQRSFVSYGMTLGYKIIRKPNL